jgi:hypothetical protein
MNSRYKNPTEGWDTIDEKNKKRLSRYREKLDRLYKFGYVAIAFDPGVQFLDTNKMSDEEQAADTYDIKYSRSLGFAELEILDNALQEIESLRSQLTTVVNM